MTPNSSYKAQLNESCENVVARFFLTFLPSESELRLLFLETKVFFVPMPRRLSNFIFAKVDFGPKGQAIKIWLACNRQGSGKNDL